MLKSVYIKHKGAVCPFCQTLSTEELEAPLWKNGKVQRDMHCGECGRVWTEVYTLTDVKYEEDDDVD